MSTTSQTLKFLTLTSLTFQNSSLIILSRYSLGILQEKYLKQSSILMSEIIKLFFALFLGLYFTWWRDSECTLLRYLGNLLRYTYLMAPVACIYYIQNYLQYFALRYLSAPVYAVVAQLKILSTALFFVMLLRGKRIYAHQWRALVYLIVGVIMVQYSPASMHSGRTTSWIGLASGLTVATLSGLAGVYFEFVLKQSQTQKMFGVWERNCQLSLCSIIFSLVTLLPERAHIQQHGLFGGFSWVSWMCVVDMALGGLLVGAVIQYADAVLKNFASSMAITLTAVVSVYAFGQKMNWLNWSGLVLVCAAVFLYSQAPPADEESQVKKED